jgi:hypothetical protein
VPAKLGSDLRGGESLGGDDDGVGFLEPVAENWDIKERTAVEEQEMNQTVSGVASCRWWSGASMGKGMDRGGGKDCAC